MEENNTRMNSRQFNNYNHNQNHKHHQDRTSKYSVAPFGLRNNNHFDEESSQMNNERPQSKFQRRNSQNFNYQNKCSNQREHTVAHRDFYINSKKSYSKPSFTRQTRHSINITDSKFYEEY
jgi:hypothetical protein